MAKDLSQTQWHGVPRQEIPWFPTVNNDACIGCELCFVTCGREVYEIELTPERRRKARVDRPYNCMVGCSTCAMVCPTEAISFPLRDIVWKVEREHKIFKLVHSEAEEKRTKAGTIAARKQAEHDLGSTQTRLRVRIAGVFGEKRFVAKLEELVKDRPFDIENLQLHVPTLKGLMESTPAYMDFEVVSTLQEAVQPILEDLKALVADNGLVWIEQR